MYNVVELTKALIAKPSITPNDHGCQQLLLELLSVANFSIVEIPVNDVSNFYAWHGQGEPSLVFAGHTDVVPAGPLKEWQTDPFHPTEKNGILYGRGAADMKAAVAAMTLAAIQYAKSNPNHPGQIGLAITSDEEGPAVDGTIKIVEYLKKENRVPKFVLVGEASSDATVGDAIKIGRRGSMHGKLIIHGKQGHIAYPNAANNAIHLCFSALNALAETECDQGNEYFPPTSFQFNHIESGIADNVIPGSLTARFNFRFAPIHSPEYLQQEVKKILQIQQLNYEIDFNVSSHPYFSGECDFSTICTEAIKLVTGKQPEFNTRGGTSDGRHFAPLGSQVIELGAVNKSIHKTNEHIALTQLRLLEQIYLKIITLSLNN